MELERAAGGRARVRALTTEIRSLRRALEASEARRVELEAETKRGVVNWSTLFVRGAAEAVFFFVVLIGLFLLIPGGTPDAERRSVGTPTAATKTTAAASLATGAGTPEAGRIERGTTESDIDPVTTPNAAPSLASADVVPGSVAERAPAGGVEYGVEDREVSATRARETPAAQLTIQTIAYDPSHSVRPEPPARPEVAVARRIEAWRSAWASRAVDEYLDAYSARFRPADGRSFRSWRRDRVARVGGTGALEIEILDLRLSELEDGRIEARFIQRYASSTFRDRVEKRLVFVAESGEWKIVQERVLRALT